MHLAARSSADHRANALSAHCLIHAGGVWFVTGSVALAALEFVIHCFVDFAKTRIENFTNQDQSPNSFEKLSSLSHQVSV